jgi:fructose-1,6-bisphosphatase II
VDYFPGGARTHSLVMRGLTGTVREIIATHRLDRLEKISRVKY